MKLASFSTASNDASWGVVADDHVIDIPRRAAMIDRDAPSDIKDLLAGPGTAWVTELLSQPIPDAEPRFALADVKLHAPLANAGKILAIGRNYRDHLDEGDIKLPKWPKLFTKFDSTVIGSGDAIVRPTITENLDYEIELGVVIGQTARKVSVESAMDYVAGYTILNDVSARDVQFADEQLTLGKNFDTFCPMGPFLTTQDELPDPAAIDLSLTVNGEVMQQSSTAYLIFPIPYLVAFASYVMTLNPGDVFLTGTPAGVGCFRNPPVWLQPGDVVECHVEGIGTLSNHVVDGSGEVPVFDPNAG